MANKQIYELTTRTFDGDCLVPFDTENTDPSTQAEKPYLSSKTSGDSLADFIANEEEYTNDLTTEDKTLTGAINELLVYVLNIADEYDSTSTYDEGDFCLYEGVLYKCLVDISVAEAWDSTHWTSTLIVDNFGGGGGASVTLGTTVPSDASGSNGDLYVQYDGTSYAVIEYFVKINGSWRKSPYSRVVALTQAEYDLITPDNQTLYVITDKQGSYVKLPIITDAWNSATSYTVGSYCIHNDTLWKCTTANSNQEPVSGSTYWDDTSVADEIGRIDTALSGKADFGLTIWGNSCTVNRDFPYGKNALFNFIVGNYDYTYTGYVQIISGTMNIIIDLNGTRAYHTHLSSGATLDNGRIGFSFDNDSFTITSNTNMGFRIWA